MSGYESISPKNRPGSAENSFGFTRIVAQVSTESSATADFTFDWKQPRFWQDNLVSDRLRVSFRMILNEEQCQGAVLRGFPNQDHSIRADALIIHTNRSEWALTFGERVGSFRQWILNVIVARALTTGGEGRLSTNTKNREICVSHWRRGSESASDNGSTHTARTPCR